MKKILLFLVFVSVSFFANAQVGGSRWYDYTGAYFIGLWQPYETSGLTFSAGAVNYYNPCMWNDSTALFGGTGTVSGIDSPYQFNELISIGQSLDPTYSPWNNADGSGTTTTFPLDWTGYIGVTPSDSYVIDSLLIPGLYTRSYASPAKDSVIDTLIVALVYGDGTSTSDLPLNRVSGIVVPGYCSGCDTLPVFDLWHDVTNNRAGHNGGTPIAWPSSAVYKFLLDRTDTNAYVYKSPLFPRSPADGTINFAVPAGNSVAMTVTFKSGDTSYHARGGNPGDTIRYSNGTSITGTKYNYWQSQVYYAVLTPGSTTPAWNWHDSTNHATGYFETLTNGWGGPSIAYYPNWDTMTGTRTLPRACINQNPHLGLHIECATCWILPHSTLDVNNIKSLAAIKDFPNPANDELNISFTLSQSTNVSVTLTNVIGQVVAAQNINNVKQGVATFNTAALPDGMYIYTMQANGERSTGKVVITH